MASGIPSEARPGAGYGSLVVFAALVIVAAVFGGMYRPDAWYEALDKAPWNPPNWVFGPVWTALYLLIAIAGWSVWRGRVTDTPILLWLASLVFNAVWTLLFFGAKQPGFALAEMLLMLSAIVGFIVTAMPVDRRAAWLFVPYACWVAYATTLTFWIWTHNA